MSDPHSELLAANTIFDSLRLTREPVLVCGSRMYSIDIPLGEDPSDFIIIDSTKYPLEESLPVSSLEAMYLDDNRAGIEGYLNQYFISLKDRHNRLSDELSRLDGIYSSMSELSLETFIKVDVFRQFINLYSRSAGGNRQTIDQDVVNQSLEMPDVPTVRELFSGESFFRRYVGRKDFLFLDGKVRQVQEVNSEGTIRIGRISYEQVGEPIPMIEFCEGYRETIISTIDALLTERGKGILKSIEEKVRCKESLEASIRDYQQEVDIDRDLPQLSIKQMKKDRYQVVMDHPPFIIKRSNCGEPKFYRFDAFKAKTTVSMKGKTVTVQSLPKVAKGYAHPFVFGDGSICYNPDSDRLAETIGIDRLPMSFSIDGKDRMLYAKRIAMMFDQCREVMTRGYFKDENDMHPVIRLYPEKFPSSLMTQAAALRSGLKVYDNDNKGVVMVG